MKLDTFFKRQLKAAASQKPGPAKQTDAEHKRAGQAHDAQDVNPSSDRDVGKAGGSSGPLTECTNNSRGGDRRLVGSKASQGATQQQQPSQDVQPIDLCDDSDSEDNTPAAAATAPAASKQPDQQQQQQRVQANKQQTQQQAQADKQQQQQQTPDEPQQQVRDQPEADAMEVDDDPQAALTSPVAPGSRAGAPAAAAVAAATPAPAAAAAEHTEPFTPAGAVAPGSAAAAAPSTAKSTGAKAAAEAPLTAEQRKQLLSSCQEEVPLLDAELGMRPDLSPYLQGHKKPLDLKQQVSLLTEGQALPLTQLSELISKTLSGSSSSGKAARTGAAAAAAEGQTGAAEAEAAADPAAAAAAAAAGADIVQDGGSEGAGPSALVVRNLIQEVASRRSYGLQDGSLANVDALEDASPTFHWCWELRTLTGLPKAAKQHADAARKHRKQVLDRLKAATAFVQLAQSFSKPTKAAEAKLSRAAAKLSKVAPLEALKAQLQAAVDSAEQQCSTLKTAQAVSRLDKAAKEEQAAAAKAEKARQAEADRSAKEAERAAKEAAKAAEAAEKARVKAEKEAEREAKRQQKAQEAAKRAAETEKKAAEVAKKRKLAEAAKAGFHSTTELHKAQNVFKSFFGLPAQRPPTPSNDGSQGQGSQMEGGSSKDAAREAARLWTRVTTPTQQQLCKMEALEQQLPYFRSSDADSSTEQQRRPSVTSLLAAALPHWRALRKQRKRIWGLPPSWAQRPGVASDPEHVQRAAAALYGEGIDISTLRCWRRKLIKHNDSVRPPFYGSVARNNSGAISGRRPFGKDVLLDYEVESDQDWEEEPEGESLSADEDGEEECDAEGDEDEEGFVVGDGYLSDDEGMRDEDEPLGCSGSQLAAAAGATAAGAPAGSSDSSATALTHLEAVLDHARNKGRHVLLVNCPGMSWEPTTQLPPALLSCLKGTLMRTDICAAPPTPAELPHLFGPAAAAAAAATGVAAAAGGTGAAAPAGGSPSAAAGADAGGAGRGRQPTVFPDSLLPALAQAVHNSKLPMDQLVKQFVSEQAEQGIKLAKARVKDKIKEISTMRMVGKAPLYTVRDDVLAALQQGTAGGAAAVTDAGAGPQDMQVDAAPPAAAAAAAAAGEPLHPQQQQQQALAAAGVRRPASEALQDQQQQQPAGAAGASADKGGSSCPPAKKQKPNPCGIERFFSASKAAKPQQQQQPAPVAAAGQQAQQQQQQGTPPSTPKRKLSAGVPSLLQSELLDTSAAAAAGGNAAGGGQQRSGGLEGAAGGSGEAAAAAGVGVDRSGALPMLTPPSDAAAAAAAAAPGDRRSKGPHSPVPFRLNSCSDVQEAAAAVTDQGSGGAGAGAQTAQQGAQGSHPKQQQQQQGPTGRQTIKHIFQRRQQQQQQEQQQQQDGSAGASSGLGSSSRGGLLGGATEHLSPIGAAGGHFKPSRLGGALKGSSSSSSVVTPPALPEEGCAPSTSFWKQLAQWVVTVREPSEADMEAAFGVFAEDHLPVAVTTMPQLMLSAMVKTLGSNTQSFKMRAFCARSIGYALQSLVRREHNQQQQQQAEGCNTPTRMQQQQQSQGETATAAVGTGRSPSPLSKGLKSSPAPTAAAGAAAARPSPSPSGSPRSAPVGASFEELCAEPGLLSNLLLCLNPEKAMQMARQAREQAGGSSELQPPTPEAAVYLAKNAARTVSVVLMVGAQLPAAAAATAAQLHKCGAVTAAAAAELRLRVASTPSWRGALRRIINESEDEPTACFALMATYVLLTDPAASSQFIANKRLASGLMSHVAKRGNKANGWAVRKWCLLVLSALLSDATFREWSLHTGTDDAWATLEAAAGLLATMLSRPMPNLAVPDSSDRDVLSHALSLVGTLLDFLGDEQQQQQPSGSSDSSLQELLDSPVGLGGCSLRRALEGVAELEVWQEAAEQAQQLLGAVGGGCDGQLGQADVEMYD